MSLSLTPVLFIHGTRSSSEVWNEQRRALEEIGHKTSAIDLPGHGSNAGSVFTVQDSLTLIGQEITDLGGKVILVGMSLGGYVALAYAADNPERVQGVLAAGCSTETARFTTRAYRQITMKTTQVWKVLQANLPRPRLPRPDRLSWTVVTDMLAEMGRVSSLSNLRALKVPVWIVSGQWCPLRFGEYSTLRAAPAAQHFIIPRAGHDVHVRAPEAFNAVMLRMLQTV